MVSLPQEAVKCIEPVRILLHSCIFTLVFSIKYYCSRRRTLCVIIDFMWRIWICVFWHDVQNDNLRFESHMTCLIFFFLRQIGFGSSISPHEKKKLNLTDETERRGLHWGCSAREVGLHLLVSADFSGMDLLREGKRRWIKYIIYGFYWVGHGRLALPSPHSLQSL